MYQCMWERRVTLSLGRDRGVAHSSRISGCMALRVRDALSCT